MCYIYDDVEEADKWVRLEHTGEQNGVGIVEWKPEQVQRFDIKHGKNKSVEIQAIDFIRTSPFVQEEVKRASENIKLTNFARLLGDKSVREILGLKYINSKLSSNLEEEEIAKALGQIILDLSDKDFKVSSIYNAKQRKDYIQGLGEKLPDKNKTIGEVWRLDNPLEQIPNLEEEDNTAKNEGSDLHSKGHLKKSIPTQRKTLIPNNCIIRISNPKANKIYDELKKIDVRSFVNCAAVTLRVFLELSVDTFIEKKGLLKEGEISASNSSRSLYQKVNDASQYLYKEKIADETILKAVKLLTKERNSIWGVDTMNAYVHSNKLSPVPIDIQTTWDNIQDFLVILEDFYNLFIYKRFERKVKIEVTNWQPCLFLRFAASCCQCLSSCCKIRNKKREYIKTSHDFFITGRFLSSMSISDSIVTSIFSKLSAMIAEIYTLIHTLPACCTALYVLFRAVRRQPCGYRSPASTHVKSVLSLPLRCARRN